jgi:hypothetical protein
MAMMFKAAEAVSKAASFDRLLIAGLLAALGIILLLSAALALRFGAENKDLVSFVGGFYKDTALILVGALANSVRHRGKQEGGES